MYRLLVVIAVVASASFTISDAMAQGRKAKKSVQPACLNALACGPQPIQQIRKPKSEKFMKATS